jgi:hypothetical protein
LDDGPSDRVAAIFDGRVLLELFTRPNISPLARTALGRRSGYAIFSSARGGESDTSAAIG